MVGVRIYIVTIFIYCYLSTIGLVCSGAQALSSCLSSSSKVSILTDVAETSR